MITKEKIDRINELAKKQKGSGLNDQEKKEQEELRTLYRQAVKENLKSQIGNIKVVSPEEYEELTKDKKCGCGCGHDHEHAEAHTHNHSCNCGCKEKN